MKIKNPINIKTFAASVTSYGFHKKYPIAVKIKERIIKPVPNCKIGFLPTFASKQVVINPVIIGSRFRSIGIRLA